MGVVVHGTNPTSKTGEYFGSSWWSWRPLWEYCEHVAPDLCERAVYAGSNDGDGLNDHNSVRLAQELRASLADGRAADYVAERDAKLAALPDLTCEFCEGTGTRTMAVPGDPKWRPEPGYCNGCAQGYPPKGTGKVRPSETHYVVTVTDVEEFAAFLEACGGFEIW